MFKSTIMAEALKTQLLDLFHKEANIAGFEVGTLRFFWSPLRTTAILRTDVHGRIVTELNIAELTTRNHSSPEMWQVFAICTLRFCLEMARLMVAAEYLEPESYTEGLACIESMCRRRKHDAIFISMPTASIDAKESQCPWLTATEIYCMERALRREINEEHILTGTERRRFKALKLRFSLLAKLPEVAYCGSLYPSYSVTGSLLRMEQLLLAQPDRYLNSPCFVAVTAQNGQMKTLAELGENWAATESPLSGGYLIRLLSITKCPNDLIPLVSGHQDRFVQLISDYERYSIAYLKTMNEDDCVLADNKLAVIMIADGMTRLSQQLGLDIDCGAVHRM